MCCFHSRSTGGRYASAQFGAEAGAQNPVIRLFRRIMPITPQLHGQRFVVRLADRTPPR